MVGVGLSTKDDNLRNDRWQLRSWQKIKYKTKGSESRVVITALLDGGISITKDDNNYYTAKDDYYFLLNVITFILLQHITIFCMIIIVLG